MGWPKSLKHNGPEGQSGRRPEGLPKRTSARSSTSSAHLSDRSTRFRHQPSPDGLSDRKAWPKTLLPTPIPRIRPETRGKPACRSSPTGAARADWGHPTGDARSEGTRGERRRQCASQTTILGTIPCTPVGTVLHNRLDTNSIVGAAICVYSIVGAVGLPYGKKPPTCLWASIVLWALGFTILGTRGRAPHIHQRHFTGTDIHPS